MYKQIPIDPKTPEERSDQALGVTLLLRLWSALLPEVSFFPEKTKEEMMKEESKMAEETTTAAADALPRENDGLPTIRTAADVDVTDHATVQRVLKDSRWTWFGFQQACPGSDLRGMGLLGLWLLVFAAEHSVGMPCPSLHASLPVITGAVFAANQNQNQNQKHQHQQKAQQQQQRNGSWMARMVREQSGLFPAASPTTTTTSTFTSTTAATHSPPAPSPPREYYPMAAAGINVASMLVHQMLPRKERVMNAALSDDCWKETALMRFLCRLHDDHSVGDSSGYGGDGSGAGGHSSLELVFALALEVVERMYERTGAGYMDFPMVLRRAQQRLGEWLGDGAMVSVSVSLGGVGVGVGAPRGMTTSSGSSTSSNGNSNIGMGNSSTSHLAAVPPSSLRDKLLRKKDPLLMAAAAAATTADEPPRTMDELWQRVNENYPCVGRHYG